MRCRCQGRRHESLSAKIASMQPIGMLCCSKQQSITLNLGAGGLNFFVAVIFFPNHGSKIFRGGKYLAGTLGTVSWPKIGALKFFVAANT